mgnify:CR=1 FL=1
MYIGGGDMEHFIKLSEAVEHTLQKARKLIQDIDKDNAGKNMTRRSHFPSKS